MTYVEHTNGFLFEEILKNEVSPSDKVRTSEIITNLILSGKNLSNADLELFSRYVANYTFSMRKMYKKVGYNKNKLLALPWANNIFKFKLGDNHALLNHSGENQSLQNHPGDNQASYINNDIQETTSNSGSVVITRLELVQAMHDSTCPMTDYVNQKKVLKSYIISKVDLEDNGSLDSAIHFFILGVRRRFIARGINQDFSKFVKKYTINNSMFLSKNFYIGNSICNQFEEFDDNVDFPFLSSEDITQKSTETVATNQTANCELPEVTQVDDSESLLNDKLDVYRDDFFDDDPLQEKDHFFDIDPVQNRDDFFDEK